MDQIKIGKFIAATRAAKKLTQDELAEKIGVTDKAISKWENGRCLPDVSLFKPLCKTLGISVNELLNGEKDTNEDGYIIQTGHLVFTLYSSAVPGGSDGKESACNSGDLGLIPGLGRSPGEGNGNPLQCSCLDNPMDRGA